VRRVACLAVMLENFGGQVVKTGYTQQDESDALVYLNEVKAFCTNRTLVITERGFYGLTPLITKPGDVACLVLGLDVPFILRPHGGAGLFKLLGESYIHGTMEGQIKTMITRKEVFEQTVVIC